jgi:serine/threonine protein kinase
VNTAIVPGQAHDLTTFEVVRELGTGSCGAVFCVRHRVTGHLVALKRYDYPESCSQEVALLRLLRHPSLPVLLDWWQAGEAAYAALELVEGHDLAQVREQRPAHRLEVLEVLEVGEQIAAALVSLHSLTPTAVIHRDVKPKNIVWSLVSGKAVLVDFDAACFAGEQEYDDQGTWGYSPPEQDAGHPVPRSDVYALGITLWELLCGRCPDPLTGHFPPLPSGTPAGVQALLRRLLRREAACRPSAQEVLSVLRGLLRWSGATDRPPHRRDGSGLAPARRVAPAGGHRACWAILPARGPPHRDRALSL